MKLKNILKSAKNKFHPQQTELQRKYLAYQKALKHLRELQDTNLQHPTKELELEIQQLDKKVVELDMKYVKFYEDKGKKVLSALQKELDEINTENV